MRDYIGLLFIPYYVIVGLVVGLSMNHWGHDPGGAVVLGIFMPLAGLMFLFLIIIIVDLIQEMFG